MVHQSISHKNLVIFGGSSYGETDQAFLDAEAVGAAVAGAGWTIVNGGYGGTMLACSRGARKAGGHVIGVGCSIFKSPPNDFCSQVEMTEDLMARLGRLIDLGHAYLTMPGSTGTLAELALVWELVNKQLIPRKPILCWGEFWRPVVSIFAQEGTQDARINTLGITERRGDLITFVHSPAEVLAAL
jgi:uncharacterized protein (TIGR00730 family)